MILSFSESVNPASLNASQITFTNSRSRDEFHSLTGGIASTAYSNIVTLKVTNDDLNVIKQRTGLAISQGTTFVAVTEYAVNDMAGNRIAAIATSNALAASDFTADSTEPELDSFDIDLAAGRLTLSFSETVNASTFDYAESRNRNKIYYKIYWGKIETIYLLKNNCT